MGVSTVQHYSIPPLFERCLLSHSSCSGDNRAMDSSINSYDLIESYVRISIYYRTPLADASAFANKGDYL